MNPVYSPVQPGAPYGNPKNMAYTGENISSGDSSMLFGGTAKLTGSSMLGFAESLVDIPEHLLQLMKFSPPFHVPFKCMSRNVWHTSQESSGAACSSQ